MMLFTIPAQAEIQHQIDAELIYPIETNEPAPFSGVLLSPKALAKITVELRSFDERQALAVKHAVDVRDAQCVASSNSIMIEKNAELAKKQSRIDSLLTINSSLEKSLKDEQGKNELVPYLIGGGFLGGIAATALVVYLVK